MNLDFLKALLGGGAAATGGGEASGGLGAMMQRVLPGAKPGGFFSGQATPPAGPTGSAGASGHSPFDMVGRINNSINPLSILMGLGGMGMPDRFRPLWKPSSKGRPANPLNGADG